jgi:opacity protein-like surface antigen
MRVLGLGFCIFLVIMMMPAKSLAAPWYVRAGAGLEWSLDADFHDSDCSSETPAALFGCGPGSDGRSLGAYGDFGNLPVLELAVGAQPLRWLRSDFSLTYRPEIDYSGQANFLNVPGEQPVTGDADSWTGMVNLFLEPTRVAHLDLGIFTPYLGAGIGMSYNHIGKMTYRFPGLTNHRLSITPSGSRVDFAFMAAIGTGIQLSERLLLDASYRYCDLGRIETDSGTMYLDSLPGGIEIAGTSAPLRTHGFLLGFRYLL